MGEWCRCDNRCDVREESTAEALAHDGETPTFVVAQPNTSGTELRLQDAILFQEEFDGIALFPFEPAEQRRDNQVQRKHTCSLR